jgi:hypothetical protein
MKFSITRLSTNKKPVPSAKKVILPSWDIRSCTEEYFNQHLAKPPETWRSEFTEHMVLSDGSIARRFPKDKKAWLIEISSLEELLAFSGEVESSLIVSGTTKELYPEIDGNITIYDGYSD